MDKEKALELLQTGKIEPEGRVAWGSNYTMLVNVCAEMEEGRVESMAIYKPQRGERPLWDFPSGTLCKRERGAWLISEKLGWEIVPPTVVRDDAPHGLGSVQLFIDHDPNIHYFDFEGFPEYAEQLQQIVLFDFVTNNADRKAGHVLLGEDGTIWAIDHGICFNQEYKLRTVIWEFAGQPIPETYQADLKRLETWLCSGECASFMTLLNPMEHAAMQKRVQFLNEVKIFPQPRPGDYFPWPPV